MDNIIILALVCAIVVLLGAIIFLFFKLKANQKSASILHENTLPNMPAVVETLPSASEIDDDVLLQINQYIEQGRSPQAIGLLKKAIVNEPNRSDLYITLLDQLAQQNDTEEFEKVVDKLHALNDDNAIAQANMLRSQMQPSPSELPVESMMAATSNAQNSNTTSHSVDELSPIEFDAPFNPESTSDSIDFDIEPTAEQQMAELETELTGAHKAVIRTTATHKAVDTTAEISFDFTEDSDSDKTTELPVLSETELDFDIEEDLNLSEPVQDKEGLAFDDVPELTFGELDEGNKSSADQALTAANELDDLPDLDMSLSIEQDDSVQNQDVTNMPELVVDEPSPAEVNDNNINMPADAMAVTNEFTFDMDELASTEVDEQAESIDKALSDGLVASTEVSNDDTGTFNFDDVLLEQDTSEVPSTSASPVSLEQNDEVVLEESIAFRDTVESVDDLSVDMDIPSLQVSDSSLIDDAEQEVLLEIDSPVVQEETETVEFNTTTATDVIPQSTDPNDTLAQLDAIFVDEMASPTMQSSESSLHLDDNTSVIDDQVALKESEEANMIATSAAISAAGLAATSLGDDVNLFEADEAIKSLDGVSESTESVQPETITEYEADELLFDDSSVDVTEASEEIEGNVFSDTDNSSTVDVSTESEDVSQIAETEEVLFTTEALTVENSPTQESTEQSVELVSNDSSPVLDDVESTSLLNQLKTEFSFVDEQDAQKTNLELAERYIGLGELMSAKTLLNEVLEAGSIEQQGEAKQLLDKVGS